jgi:hypothetical protein
MTPDKPACPCVWLGEGRTDNKGVTWRVCWAVSLRLPTETGLDLDAPPAMAAMRCLVLARRGGRRCSKSCASRLRGDECNPWTAWPEVVSQRVSDFAGRGLPQSVFLVAFDPTGLFAKKRIEDQWFRWGKSDVGPPPQPLLAEQGWDWRSERSRQEPGMGPPTRLYSALGNNTGVGDLHGRTPLSFRPTPEATWVVARLRIVCGDDGRATVPSRKPIHRRP